MQFVFKKANDMKTLDLNKSVYELTQEYPEVVDIMAALGFTDITKKAMLLSVGRVMTIPKGQDERHPDGAGRGSFPRERI